jgi:membrane protein DedA with SNARE-associated domain
MFEVLESRLIPTVQNIFDQFGWLGVAALLAFENATGLTPSEIILGLAGWMLLAAHQMSPASIFIGAAYATLGSVAGASLAYWVARLGGRPVVLRLATLARIQPDQIETAEELMLRWGSGIVLFGRLIPGVRTLISIPAGLVKMPFPKFLAATAAGAYAWCALLIGAGYMLGKEWMMISDLVKTYTPWVIAAGGFLAISAFVVIRLGKKYFERQRLSIKNS